MTPLTESVIESAALAWLESTGWQVRNAAERSDPNYRDVLLDGRLRQAFVRLNPDLPPDALEDAYRKLMRNDMPGHNQDAQV